jgi:hypothetical protein
MRALSLGLVVGVILAGLIAPPPVIAQTVTRLYATYLGTPIALQATVDGYLKVTGTP